MKPFIFDLMCRYLPYYFFGGLSGNCCQMNFLNR